MAEYYLVSQLPSLDGISDNMPLPITEERFFELCNRFLGKKALSELNKLSVIPSRSGDKSSSALISAWNENERSLRLVLGKIRASKMEKVFQSDDEQFFSASVIKAANIAVESENPLDAERTLNKFRLEFLESLRPMDSFSGEYVFYYCLKLKLLLRMRQFDFQTGKTAYKNIYNSILNADRSEVIQ